VTPPPKWKPQTAHGAAPCPELLDFAQFGKALARVGFEARPNIPSILSLICSILARIAFT
jgi:hypothetical protein